GRGERGGVGVVAGARIARAAIGSAGRRGGDGDQRAGRDAPVAGFPVGEVGAGEERVGLGGGPVPQVHDRQRRPQVLHGDRVDGGRAGDRVDGRVYVGAGVLADAEQVHQELRRSAHLPHPEVRVPRPHGEALVQGAGQV